MKKFINWIIISSANPDKFSATIKGILLQYAGIIIFVLAKLHVPITDTQFGIDAQYIAIALGAMLSAFGLVRKAYIAIRYGNTTEPVL